jgi:hypothetical protein
LDKIPHLETGIPRAYADFHALISTEPLPLDHASDVKDIASYRDRDGHKNNAGIRKPIEILALLQGDLLVLSLLSGHSPGYRAAAFQWDAEAVLELTPNTHELCQWLKAFVFSSIHTSETEQSSWEDDFCRPFDLLVG